MAQVMQVASGFGYSVPFWPLRSAPRRFLRRRSFALGAPSVSVLLEPTACRIGCLLRDAAMPRFCAEIFYRVKQNKTCQDKAARHGAALQTFFLAFHAQDAWARHAAFLC